MDREELKAIVAQMLRELAPAQTPQGANGNTNNRTSFEENKPTSFHSQNLL